MCSIYWIKPRCTRVIETTWIILSTRGWNRSRFQCWCFLLIISFLWEIHERWVSVFPLCFNLIIANEQRLCHFQTFVYISEPRRIEAIRENCTQIVALNIWYCTRKISFRSPKRWSLVKLSEKLVGKYPRKARLPKIQYTGSAVGRVAIMACAA